MTAYFLQFSGSPITPGPVLATGGEASVRFVLGHAGLLAKIFTIRSPVIEEKLMAMISAPPPCLSLGGGYAELAWPIDIVRDADAGNECVGYVMPNIRNRLRLEEIANPAACPQQIDFSLRLRMATNVAWMMAELHAAGYVVGDLHLGNLLGDQAGCVCFIDTDSFQFVHQGQLFRCEVGKSDFIAPELHNKRLDSIDRLPNQDAFALAICVFQLLMDGNHPYQGKWIGKGQKPPLPKRIARGIWPYAQPAPKNWRPRSASPPFEILHPLIRNAMIRCFKQGHRNPARRPSASKWHKLLLEVENDQAYLDRTVRRCQKASWRKRSPRKGAKNRHASTGNRFMKWTSYIVDWTNRLWLDRKRGILLTASITVLLVGVFLAYEYRSCVFKALNLDPPPRFTPENYGSAKPTPKIWDILRDSP
jgi:DNA-binding helix-hairpin-helix protein with protein kinase domain